MSPSGTVAVTGGADGIAAHVEDLLAMSVLLRTNSASVADALADLAPLEWSLMCVGRDAAPAAAAVWPVLGPLVAGLRAIEQESAALAFGLIMAAESYRKAEQDVGSSFLGRLADAVWGTSGIRAALVLLPAVIAPGVPDGAPVLHDLGPEAATDLAPHTLSDLVVDLSTRDAGAPGEISVSFVVGADGGRRAIVDIPGTKSWNPAPVRDVTSVGTDVIAITGRSTSYEQGVLQALTDAGVGPDTEVMLVGHSEGGIVAVDAARHAAASGRFRITHVVTAGSPVGALARGLPENVQLLSLENAADVVPALDGVPNPDRPNVTTVRFVDQHGSIGANHSLTETYQPEAAAAQTSGDASVGFFLSGAHEFLDSARMTTHDYLVTRDP